ncbi:diaminopimelate epimerase [Elstera litoralis]|uniref:Diaminopimelate epimerase n=1 Tax=Elstera litoralis TaxID=552518 RepID=A0A0F3IV97_9PROT|nr:diaminopimelate epimerase [Elstera litoralis]KJV10655.1 diaminopimelate epimerase [Elstera litoralis]
MGLPFLKMHGLGNDFVILEGRRAPLELPRDWIRAVGDRRTGVGFDQLIVMEPPSDGRADLFMRIFNPDGSESGACGNATRCIAHIAMQAEGRGAVVIETLAGLLPAQRVDTDVVTVDMGPARLAWDAIPLARAVDTLHVPMTLGPLSDGVATNMGNPHITFFVPDAEAVDLATWGPQAEHHPLVPERANIGLVSVLARDHIRFRVWERGAGITRACGSGACAAAVAAIRRGLTDRRLVVSMDGGDLTLEWRADDGHVLMTGPIATSFFGEFVGDLALERFV